MFSYLNLKNCVVNECLYFFILIYSINIAFKVTDYLYKFDATYLNSCIDINVICIETILYMNLVIDKMTKFNFNELIFIFCNHRQANEKLGIKIREQSKAIVMLSAEKE